MSTSMVLKWAIVKPPPSQMVGTTLGYIIYTLPETNIAPENGWLQHWFPFGMAYFLGAMLVSGSVPVFCSD